MSNDIKGSPHPKTIGMPATNLTGQMGHPGKQQPIKGSPSQVPQLGKDTFQGGEHPEVNVNPTKPV